MSEQTTGSRFRLGVGAAEDWRMAVDACLLQLMPLSDTVNVGFVYISDRMADDLPRIMRRLSDATGIETLIATCGYSVAAGATEYCDESVVAVLIGAVPEGSATIFRRPAERPQGWLGFVPADPQGPARPGLLGGCSEYCGTALVRCMSRARVS